MASARARSAWAPGPGALTGDPAGLATGGGDATVEGCGELERHPGATPLEAGEKAPVLMAACLFEDADLDPQTAGAEADADLVHPPRGWDPGARPRPARFPPPPRHRCREASAPGDSRARASPPARRREGKHHRGAAARSAMRRSPREVPPAGRVHPRPSTRSPRYTTAPTGGFGKVVPSARRACPRARRMARSGVMSPISGIAHPTPRPGERGRRAMSAIAAKNSA